MSEQTTGRHLSQQPPAEQNGQPSGAPRPVSTARTAASVRYANTGRSAYRQPGDAPARPTADSAWTEEYADGGRSGGSRGPSGPGKRSGSGGEREKPPLDMLVRFIVIGLLFVSMSAFAYFLYRTEMLAGKYLLIIGVMLLVIFVVVAILVFAFGKNRRPWGGIAASVLLSAVMIAGTVMASQGTEALRAITSSSHNFSHVTVYVRDDDPAQSLEDIAGYSFGVMETMSHEGVDKAIADINEELGTTIQTTGFTMPTALVSALFDGSINAVITDVAYIDGLRELETYGDLVNRMRGISDIRVQIAPENTQTAQEIEDDDHIYTILITGIDSRNGLVRSSLSDVNILVTVNTDTRQVLMVSTPRDYRVPFSNTGELDKLTHAGWYGEEVCMETIGNIYDIDIDYYFRVNFEGFVNIIDALGGVTVYSDYDFTSNNVQGYHFNQGENQMNGAQALAFARERKAFAEGDRQRGRNQMAVIRAVVNKVMSSELLARYTSVINAVEGCFETTVPYSLIASLVRRQLNEGGDWNIVSYNVSGEDSYQVSPMLGMTVYMMIPDETTIQTAKDMMNQVINGQILEEEGVTVGT